MSYWSHNPELYDEIIYAEMERRGLVREGDDREVSEIVAEQLDKPNGWELAVDAERNYWSDQADIAEQKKEEENNE